VLDAIVLCFPRLERLGIDVARLQSPEVLSKLTQLRECCLSCRDVSGLEFVAGLSHLETLYVWLDVQVEEPLVLPPGLGELRCYCSYDDSSKFFARIEKCEVENPSLRIVDLPAASLLVCPLELLAQVHTLSCIVEQDDIADVLRLAASLPYLKRLSLMSNSDDDRDVATMRVFCDWCSTSDLCVPVVSLKLPSVEMDPAAWDWLQAFPCLTELELMTSGDSYAEAFTQCPLLRRLVDQGSAPRTSVTVDKTEDGRLIKRSNDSRTELEKLDEGRTREPPQKTAMDEVQALLEQHALGACFHSLNKAGVLSVQDLASLDLPLLQEIGVREDYIPKLWALVESTAQPRAALQLIENETLDDFLARTGFKRYRHVLPNKGIKKVQTLLKTNKAKLLSYGILPVHANALAKLILELN
jgi:hypothetical protein